MRFIIWSAIILCASPAFGVEYRVDGYFLPPASSPFVQASAKFYDGAQLTHLIATHIEGVSRGIYFFQIVKADPSAKEIRVAFDILLPGYITEPNEMTLAVDPAGMHISTVTWRRDKMDRADAYLSAIQKAQSLIPSAPAKAAADAEYATALAETANQKIEAVKTEAAARIANNKPLEAADAFVKVAVAANFDKADPQKKDVFFREWFDAVELAAKSTGVKADKETGLVTKNLPVGSPVAAQLDVLSQVLSKYDPTFSKTAPQEVNRQTQVLNSSVAAKENVLRAALDRNPVEVK